MKLLSTFIIVKHRVHSRLETGFRLVGPQGRVTLVVLLCVLNCPSAWTQELKIDVEMVTESEIVYRSVIFGSVQRVKLAEVNVWPQIVGRDPFYSYLNDSTDLQLELLRRGWATVKDSNRAPPAYLRAESEAKQAKTGMWASQTGNKSEEPVRNTDWTAIFFKVGEILLWLFSVGLLAAIVRWVYMHWYIQRRVRLVLLGEPSGGKSAILERLLNPKITRDQILELTMTRAVQRRRHQHFIPKGRFEIHPTLVDVPGAGFGAAWDTLMEARWSWKHWALLVVLAPTAAGGSAGNGTIDEKYVFTQLGYVQAFVAGGLSSWSGGVRLA